MYSGIAVEERLLNMPVPQSLVDLFMVDHEASRWFVEALQNVAKIPAPKPEPENFTCERCGNEWPTRFGKCPCRMRLVQIHEHDMVCAATETLPDSLNRLCDRLYSDTCKSAEFADCAGEEPPYADVLGQIDHAIGRLKRFRREMQSLAGHSHEWSTDDYCRICGRDGRA